MKMSKEICDICCDKFTVQKRKEIKCNLCNKSACIKCIETYLLSSIHKPHCMHCRKEYSIEFQMDNFNQTLLKKFKTHTSEINFEKEKTLLPQAQLHIENLNKAREIDNEIAEMKKKIGQLLVLRQNILSRKIKQEKIKITRQCPENKCRGFLSCKWKCGVCQQKFCNKCHDKLCEEHTCDEEKLKSAELIRKQCKNCPKCGVTTFKISGCPQMWCTSCNSAWNWKTGKIETGIIHNPHYFEYLRKTGTDMPRQRCGVLPSYLRLRRHLPNYYRFIADHIPFVNHITQYEIDKLNRIINKVNLDLRVRYLKNEITEKQFKSTLKRRETRRIKSEEVRNIFQMFSRACSDLLVNLADSITPKHCLDEKVCENFHTQLINLIIYTNKYLKIFGERYNTKYPLIKINKKNFLYISN